MTMNLLESVNYSVKHTLFKEKKWKSRKLEAWDETCWQESDIFSVCTL